MIAQLPAPRREIQSVKNNNHTHIYRTRKCQDDSEVDHPEEEEAEVEDRQEVVVVEEDLVEDLVEAGTSRLDDVVDGCDLVGGYDGCDQLMLDNEMRKYRKVNL